MKPLLPAIYCLLMLSLAAQAQIYVGAHNGLPYQDTSKRIVFMRTTHYQGKMVNGQIVKGKKTDEVLFYYDKHGSLVKRVILLPAKNVLQTRSGEYVVHMMLGFNDSAIVVNPVEYDKHGNLTVLPHDPFVYNMRGKFKYNEQNQLTEVRQYNTQENNILDKIQTYQYNAQGKAALREERDALGKLVEKMTFEYDKAGRLIEIANADSTHSTSRTKLIYDNRNNKLMHLVLISEDRLPLQYDYEYDNKDRKSKIYVIYGDTKRLYSFYKYDAIGEGYQYTEINDPKIIVQTIGLGVKKREVFEDNHPQSLQQSVYDKHNNIIYQTEGFYPLPPEKIELRKISIVENDIKYRGGIFDRVGLWFKHKGYPPRAGAR